ncbi:endothiapepsin [Physcia stellaris]|nr:endothiapepsin [Physcia stellaris]
MAPDRGSTHSGNSTTRDVEERNDINDEESVLEDADSGEENESTTFLQNTRRRSEAQSFLDDQNSQGQNFTLRGVLVGLVIGVIICFSNTYFGLQTGWVSGMAMPAALIGFAYFKIIARWINYPFTPVENVLVQTVAGAVGTMPLGCGFVGVVPALNFLMKTEENGPIVLSTWQLIVWALGLCFFGMVIAVPLRREVIIREKLKFPSGTATALMIGVLHDKPQENQLSKVENGLDTYSRRSQDLTSSTSNIAGIPPKNAGPKQTPSLFGETTNSAMGNDHADEWKAKIRQLIYAFALSALYTIFSYFIPQVHNIPIFGLSLAQNWLWTLNPSPAYVGQGIIMGPATTLHMLLGAIFGWGVLSPLAKNKGWAPAPVEDWTHGSKGWIVWVSLAVMLADSVVSLGWLVLRPLIFQGPVYLSQLRAYVRDHGFRSVFRLENASKGAYTMISPIEPVSKHSELEEPDAPPSHLVSNRTISVLFVISVIVCVVAVKVVFGKLVPVASILLAIFLALLLSLMGVRALGETDLNPVSGISKLTQLFFALITPSSSPNAITINLLAGAISESGALQAGDMMQDLKTGHLMGAAPNAQFYGQMIGSAAGAVVSAVVYKLYTSVYEVPGGLFQVPTAYVWIFTARLVTGQGLPDMAVCIF